MPQLFPALRIAVLMIAACVLPATAQEPPATLEFTEATASQTLGILRSGLETRNLRSTMSAFDREHMAGYLSFEDRLQSLFSQYGDFRVRFRILQSSLEGDRGMVLTEFQIEAQARSETGAPLRRDAQVRFEMMHGPTGWRIVDFKPRSFFL